MTMVEKVARAIETAKNKWCEEAGDWNADIFPSEVAARTAIEAMREPTDAMMQAGADGSGEDSEAVALCTWEAMIDAALQEQTSPGDN